jgi:guanylate kinase
MANEVDMSYRFTSDDEPTEEQLATLMQEAQEEVLKKDAKLQQIIAENIQREYENIKRLYPNL